jgi:hypothetical protein
MRPPASEEPSASCTGGGEATTSPAEHARLTRTHLESYRVPLVLLLLPLVLSAPRGTVLVESAAFPIAPPSLTMYISLPKHNRALYPSTDSLLAPPSLVLLLSLGSRKY